MEPRNSGERARRFMKSFLEKAQPDDFISDSIMVIIAQFVYICIEEIKNNADIDNMPDIIEIQIKVLRQCILDLEIAKKVQSHNARFDD